MFYLNLKTKRLAITRRSKPTLTKTKSLRMMTSLWVIARRRTVIKPWRICAGRGVFESIWSKDRNLGSKISHPGSWWKTHLGRWPSREAAKANLPPINPLPRRDPNRERKMRKEKGVSSGKDESVEANVRTKTWANILQESNLRKYKYQPRYSWPPLVWALTRMQCWPRCRWLWQLRDPRSQT